MPHLMPHLGGSACTMRAGAELGAECLLPRHETSASSSRKKKRACRWVPHLQHHSRTERYHCLQGCRCSSSHSHNRRHELPGDCHHPRPPCDRLRRSWRGGMQYHDPDVGGREQRHPSIDDCTRPQRLHDSTTARLHDAPARICHPHQQMQKVLQHKNFLHAEMGSSKLAHIWHHSPQAEIKTSRVWSRQTMQQPQHRSREHGQHAAPARSSATLRR
jgi:hypothetical protein